MKTIKIGRKRVVIMNPVEVLEVQCSLLYMSSEMKRVAMETEEKHPENKEQIDRYKRSAQYILKLYEALK